MEVMLSKQERLVSHLKGRYHADEIAEIRLRLAVNGRMCSSSSSCPEALSMESASPLCPSVQVFSPGRWASAVSSCSQMMLPKTTGSRDCPLTTHSQKII